MENKKLNLGCGHDIRTGWINLDKAHLPGIDIVHDIEKIPLPFSNEQFDTILCQDILEHVDFIPVLREIHRILKTGGELHLRVPHFTSWRNFDDPTHKNMFSIRTFDYFVKNCRIKREYYFDFHFSKIKQKRFLFDKNPFFYNYIVEIVVNSHKIFKDILYEATCISRLFPANSVVIVLQK